MRQRIQDAVAAERALATNDAPTQPLPRIPADPTVNGIDGQPEPAVSPERAVTLEPGVRARPTGNVAASPPPAAVVVTRAKPGTSARKKRGHRSLIAACLVAVTLGAIVTVWVAIAVATRTTGSPAVSAGVARDQAATWVTRQLSPDAIVSCDRTMCATLAAHGFPARNLRALGPAAPFPVTSDLVVVTAAVRSLFGTSLRSAWAPAVIATFGSGSARITVNVIAPHGAAAYQAALSADVRARKASGAELLSTDRISVSATASKQLAAGQVDARLLVVMADLAAEQPIDIVQFGDLDPGASAGIPFRSADLAENDRPGHIGGAAYLRSIVAVLSTMPAQFRPASTETVLLPRDQRVLRIEFAAPSPLGLLGPQGST